MTRLSEEHAEQYAAEHAFDTGPAGFVAAAVEFLPVALVPADHPPGAVFEPLRHGHLAGDYAGVLRVSTPPAPGLDVAVRHLTADLAQARSLLARAGFAPGERAVDTHRPEIPEAKFQDTTASVRICLDAGPDAERRWTTAQAIAPVLAAAFANSPMRNGRPTGWRSTRQALRLAADRPLPPGDPRTSWTRYALGGRSRSGFASVDDLRRHLDNLPAPVRPRGHLELSMIDAQPGDGWRVALAVTTALVEDERAAREAATATATLPPDAWTRAARDALADPAIAEAARACFVAAYAALARQGIDRHLRDAVATYIHRYVSRGRTPADDLLDALRTPT
jgi:glutamate--cysteine ligase